MKHTALDYTLIFYVFVVHSCLMYIHTLTYSTPKLETVKDSMPLMRIQQLTMTVHMYICYPATSMLVSAVETNTSK